MSLSGQGGMGQWATGWDHRLFYDTYTSYFKFKSSITRSEYLHVFSIFSFLLWLYSQIVNTYNDIFGWRKIDFSLLNCKHKIHWATKRFSSPKSKKDLHWATKIYFRHLNLKKKKPGTWHFGRKIHWARKFDFCRLNLKKALHWVTKIIFVAWILKKKNLETKFFGAIFNIFITLGEKNQISSPNIK